MIYNTINKIGVILLLICTKDLSAQYKLEKLGPKINSAVYDEISPVITRNGRTMYFTRIGTPEFNRTLIQDDIDLSKTLPEVSYLENLKLIYSQIAQTGIENPITSSINQDVWVADSRESLFDRVFHPSFPLNSALPNSVCALAPEDHRIVTINHFARDGSMFKGFSFMDRKPDGSFSYPDPIYIHDFHSKNAEVNISMSKDGDVIILSLDRPEGQGDADLYVSFKLKRNLWSEPVNMGPIINSAQRDITPFLTEDKSRLFFASNRPGGKGGTDIYVTRRLDYTWMKWSPPQPLEDPINSPSDDSNPVYIEPDAYIYFISRRDGTSDIFKADINPAAELEQPITLRGTIRHSVTNEPLQADLFYGPSRDVISDQVVHSPYGIFELKIDKKDLFRLSPKKPGFVGKNQLVDATILAHSDALIYEIDFYLSPMVPEQKIEVNNIYFEKGLPIVKPDSYAELDRLASILVQKPSIQIRIEGHTDSIGYYNELMDLSIARAEEIKKYLVTTRAIDSRRILTSGHGSIMPIASNDSEENRSINRRVEVYITNPVAQKAIVYKELRDPKVIAVRSESISGQTLVSNKYIDNPENQIKQPNLTTGTAQAIHYGDVKFISNELALKESSILQIGKLIDYLAANTSKKITLIGMCDPSETMTNYATQRAKGVKEYLVYKSIAADRIDIQDAHGSREFSGVKVYVDK